MTSPSVEAVPARCAFLTSHARLLLAIADAPGATVRDLATRVEVTERQAHRLLDDLVAAGYVVPKRVGRRNRYDVRAARPMPDPVVDHAAVGDLLVAMLR